ncbi:MAG: choice-of-anchor Q domain-containing protein, partial [Planctomycetota bacterium]
FNGNGDLTNTNAIIGPLQNNGGRTRTHDLLSGSPAINAGDPAFSGLAFDQRGATRIRGGRLDIGALEVQGEAPTFTSSTSVSVDENQTVAQTLTANANGPVTFSIVGGADQSRFNLAGTQLRFNAAPDFENPTDAGGNNVYEVRVRATSGGLFTDQTVAVTVDPVNDNSPVFTSSNNAVIPENTTAVQTLTATDADLPTQNISFSITGGVDASEFQIVNGSQLRFVNAPDFENPTDSNGNNIYIVQLTADDGNGRTTNQNFSVRVTDVIENTLQCDFDGDNDCDGADIDLLQANIVNGPADPATFDLTGDGQVTIADRNEWLALAGAENLTSGNPYRLGDANLDGTVDISDFNLWNANKFTPNSAWTQADFNSDGSVDISDFNIWNANKFTSSDSANRGLTDHSGDDRRDESTELNRLDQLFAELA